MSDLPPIREASPSSASRPREVRIATGSRLHFGLLDTVEPFGGVGAMIESPGTEVIVRSASSFDYFGPQASRVVAIAKRVIRFSGLDKDLPPCQIEVARVAPAHQGLGSGTQLSLAVAEGICRCLGISVDSISLATQLASRGKRSAIGIHGYFQGGLIYESLSPLGQLNEIQQRSELPGDWCVAILRPVTHDESVHGVAEAQKFARLAPADPAQKCELQRIAWQDLMPSAGAGDFEAFCSAIRSYNRSSGMLFASIQGGPYNGVNVQAIIQWLTEQGVIGVGQSSWGPSVFAWFESREKAKPLLRRLPSDIELIALANVINVGRKLREMEER